MNSRKPRLNIAIINGLVVALIGTLIFITPLAVSVPGNLVAMDWIAGSILVVVGIACIIWGRRRAT